MDFRAFTLSRVERLVSILRVISDALIALLAVEALQWVGLVLLILCRLLIHFLFEGGKVHPNVGLKKFWPILADVLRVLIVVFVVTVGGNSVPVLGWTIVAVWTWATFRTIGEIVKAVTPEDSDIRSFITEVISRVKERNLSAYELPRGNVEHLPDADSGTGPTENE